MNPFSYESELLAIALCLYLYDASLLLYANEALLVKAGNARWSAVWGWPQVVLRGKSLCILNPFTPHQAAFRLRWDFAGRDASVGDERWTERASRLRRLTLTTLAAALGLFVLLPLGLFSPLGTYAVIAAVIAIYGSTVVGLALLGGMREDLGLSRRRFAGFAFECLACPPFSAHMLRRLALAQPVKESLIQAAVRLCDADGWAALRGYCESRLDEEMQATAAGSSARAGLEGRKRELSTLTVSP